jgi:tape measure domain-containing protein
MADGTIKILTDLDQSGIKNGLSKMSSLITKSISTMTKAIAGVSSALAAAAGYGIKYNAQMEQYMTSFETMLGSAEKATSMVSELKEFAAKTPFEFTDLAKGTQTLLAFGTSAEDIMPTIKMLGDVSQGNKEKFDSLALVFGQVSSQGKLMGQDLLQMINAGFNPLKVISDKTGESMASLKDKMSDGKITIDDVTQAFVWATEEGGQFYNAMENQSKTFNGQLSTLKDNVSAFVGEVTEGMFGSLKDTALPMVNGWLGELQDAFRRNGTKGLVSAFGDVLANAVTTVAKKAPGVVESAADVISAFAKGLYRNRKEIVQAAKDFVKTLANGIADLLPKEIQKPIKDMIEGIEDALSGGGISKAVTNLISVLKPLVTAAANLANVVLPPLVKIIDVIASALPLMLPVIGAITAAIIAQSAASAALSVQLGIATVAQNLFNASLNANPIILVIGLIGGLIAAIVALTSTQEEEITKSDLIVEKNDELMESMRQRKEAYDEAKQASYEAAEVDLYELDRVQRLSKELMNLADENGNVTDANKDRAEFILGELNKALGTEYEMTGNQIQNYKDLEQSVWNLIAAKRAETLLSAQEEVYNNAIKERAQAEKKIVEVKKAVLQQEQELENARLDLVEMNAEKERVIREQGTAGWTASMELKRLELEKTYNDESSKLDGLKTDYDEANATLQGYYNDITLYESMYAEASQGNYDLVIDTLTKVGNKFIESKDLVGKTMEEQKQILGNQYFESLLALSEYAKNYVAGVDGYTAEELEILRQQAIDARAEAENVGVEIVNGQIEGIDGEMWDFEQINKDLAEAGVDGFESVDTNEAGDEFVSGYTGSIGSQSSIRSAINAASALARAALGAVKSTQKSGSPSKITAGFGKDFDDGYMIGIEKNSHKVESAAEQLTEDALSAVENVDSPSLNWLSNLSFSDIAEMAQQIRSAVQAEAQRFSALFTAKANYAIATASPVVNTTVMPAPVNAEIHTTLEIDGKVAGEALTPYIDQNLGTINARRERGG